MAVPRTGNKRMANRPANGNNMRRFKPGNQQPRRMNMGGIGAMFNTNQIPSNGYLDFTEPTSNNTANNTITNNQKQFKNNNSNNIGPNGSANNGNNNKNRNIQRRSNNGQRAQGGMSNNNMNGGNRQWGNNNRGRTQSMANNNRNNMNNSMRQGNMMHNGQFNGPRMHAMGPMPPMPPMGMLPPLQMMNGNGRFPPRPFEMPPPIGGPMGPIRRPPNFRMGPGPFPNRAMMPRNNGAGPIRRNKVAGGMVNKNNRRNGGSSAQTNQKNRKKNQIKNGKRTNQNVNKYALDKPWVNDEIKEAHQLKTDLENQLKGKKNDEIFAKFKEQRDKFVSLYDAAKQAFVTTQKEVNI